MINALSGDGAIGLQGKKMLTEVVKGAQRPHFHPFTENREPHPAALTHLRPY